MYNLLSYGNNSMMNRTNIRRASTHVFAFHIVLNCENHRHSKYKTSSDWLTSLSVPGAFSMAYTAYAGIQSIEENASISPTAWAHGGYVYVAPYFIGSYCTHIAINNACNTDVTLMKSLQKERRSLQKNWKWIKLSSHTEKGDNSIQNKYTYTNVVNIIHDLIVS